MTRPREYGLDEADAQRFVGAQVPTAEHQVLGPALADVTREALRPAEAGRDAEADLGLAELGVLGGQADVAGQRQFAAAAEGEAVDGGDPGLRGRLEVAQTPARARRSAAPFGREVLHLGDVGAGDEGLVAGAGQHDDPHLGVGASPRAAASSTSLVSVLSALSASGRSTVTTATAPSRATRLPWVTLLGPWDWTGCASLYRRGVGGRSARTRPSVVNLGCRIVNLYTWPLAVMEFVRARHDTRRSAM